MKKSLLAIAIAAAVPAVASAQVTVGGIMDGGFNNVVTKTQTGTSAASETTRVQTGGNAAGALASNRLFFRGTEKIGDMTAGFHYELGMDAGGTGDLSTTGGVRRSVVSLAGGFGTVEIGRDYTPIFSLSCSLDTSMCDNVNIGKSVYLAGSGTDGIRVTTVRNSGQIMYTTPTMGGLVARVAVTNRSNDTKVNGDVESTGGSLVYSAGPLMVGAAVNNQDSWAGTTSIAKTAREEMIFGGSYMVSQQLSLQFQNGSIKTNGVKTYQGNQIGARFNFTPSMMVHASFGSGDGVGTDLKNAFKLGLINNLSKRTRLYALYGSDELETKSGTTVTKRDRSEFAVGLNHAF